MHRKLKAIALATALAAATGGVAAQDFVFGWNPRSGDVWVDTRLADINQYGYRYREPFIDEMTRYYDAPRDLVSDLLLNRRWAPGDVYYACALAQIAGQPCRSVVEQWERDHGQGWGVIAQRMGIKPGSAEFHRLKKGFVPSYDRWGRPIVIDNDLRIDFPDRGKGPKGTAWIDGGRGPGDGQAHGNGHGSDKGRGNDKGHGNGKGQGKSSAPGAGHGQGKSGGGRGNQGGHGNSGDKPHGGNANKGHGHGKG